MAGLSYDVILQRLVAMGVPEPVAREAAAREAATPPAVRPVASPKGSKHKGLDLEQRKFRIWCRQNDIPMPVCEHPIRKPAHLVRIRQTSWRFDYAWPAVDIPGGVALEVQGGVFIRGRNRHGGRLARPEDWEKERTKYAHQGMGHLRDMDKINAAQMAGWIVIQRIPTNLYTPETVVLIKEALAAVDARPVPVGPALPADPDAIGGDPPADQ